MSNWRDFQTLEFPENDSAVYILCFITEAAEEVPFYIGETSSFYRRMSEYLVASFDAATDFKVGEAVRYFSTLGHKVIVRYKASENREREEAELITEQQSEGHRLLNDLAGYDYRVAEREEERKKVKRFCDKLLEEV